MNREIEFVLKTVKERNIKFIRLWFTDIVGSLKSVAIAPTEIENAFEKGLVFDGSSIEGLTRVSESDMLAYPDPTTFQILPWRSEYDKTARMFCDIKTPSNLPSLTDSRFIMRKTLQKAASMGFTVYTHPEIEFYLFKKDKTQHYQPIPIDHSSYFDHEPNGVARDFRLIVVNMLEAIGISVQFSHHEAGPGQNEIDLRYADALNTADNIMTLRTLIKEIAAMKGIYASFMPKPFTQHPGSGMHTHFSLFQNDTNVLFDKRSEDNLSKTGHHFLAGILKHAPEFTAITNQYINSYKRLWGGGEAPNFISWGHNDRSALVRIPIYNSNKHQGGRLEYRGIDSAANPYLAYSIIIAAGLKGIEEEYAYSKEIDYNINFLGKNKYNNTSKLKSLPMNLKHALNYMSDSEFIFETLGEKLFNFFLRNKTKEWEEYQGQVTEFELRRYLDIL